ncbi:MAG TPA: hypothetical protein ENI18_11065 [Candidatus Aminicenantes bacterium]|nr:hypothetical protein [Candidatus Aminicenantes bacterium]
MIRLSVSKTRGISPARKSRSDTGFALLSGSDFVLMLIIGLNFIYEHYFMIKSDPRNHARSALLTVFSITHPDLFYITGLRMLTRETCFSVPILCTT